MCLKRARLVPWLLLGLLLAVGCASSATVDNGDDAGVQADGGKTDRVQQDAPPFDQDATPLPDGSEQDDAAVQDDAGNGDGPQDAQHDAQQDAQQDAQHDTAVQQDATIPDGGCTPEADEALGGDTCVAAIDKGSLSDLASSSLTITGNLWPAGDVDWYKVTFVDSPDDASACDKFNARIAFAANGNPGNRYAFDVLLGNCADSPVCGTAGDSNLATTEFKWDDSGECPCNADPVNTLPGIQVCVDHSMVLRIRVFRVSGSPICESYVLELRNGA
jgi:hypothetical protein